VLIADDNADLLAYLVRLLGPHWPVSTARNGEEALDAARRDRPDLVLADVMMPDRDGLALLAALRADAALAGTPVILLTALAGEDSAVAGLLAGADDYVVKPFGADQLDARIRAVLRRVGADAKDPTVVVGGLEVDPRARRARLDGQVLDLTPREFDLLYYLADRADQVVTKGELLAQVWQIPYSSADKTVDVHISWLRRKLGETALEPRYLHTVRRVGIRLSAPTDGS
jgi:DNA-binding response OmpR family regulator